MTDLERETLFSAIGLMPILEGKPRLRNEDTWNQDKLRGRLERILGADEVKGADEVPAFDYDRVLALVSEGPGPEDTAALFNLLGNDDIADELTDKAEGITSWANEIMPRDATKIAGGQIRQGTPDAHTVADFRRQWQVADDPEIVLRDMEDGSLADEQVQTMLMHYPAIYAEVRQAAKDALATLIAKRGKDWEPSPIKSAMLETLLQESTFDPDLAATMAQIYAATPEAAGPAKPASRRTKNAALSSSMTPGEKAAASVTSASS